MIGKRHIEKQKTQSDVERISPGEKGWDLRSEDGRKDRSRRYSKYCTFWRKK